MDVEFLIPEEECVSPVLLLGPHAKDIDIEMKACLKISVVITKWLMVLYFMAASYP